MLDDRERRTLARIEHELASSDPDFVRKFAFRTAPRVTGAAVLLAVGLAVMVLGSALVSVGIAVAGMAVACVALMAAHHRRRGFRPA